MATSDDDEELRRRRLCRDRDDTNTTSIDDDYAKGKCDKELIDTKGIGVHLRIRSLFRDASNDYCEKGDQCRRSRGFEHGEAEFVFI